MLIKATPEIVLQSDGTNIDVNNLFYGNKFIQKVGNIKTADGCLVSNCTEMFKYASNIEEIDLSGFITTESVNLASAFKGCTNLKKLIAPGITFSNITTYTGVLDDVPLDCYILVKDETQKKVLLNYYELTNVHYVGEEI